MVLFAEDLHALDEDQPSKQKFRFDWSETRLEILPVKRVSHRSLDLVGAPLEDPAGRV
jgi:hypothetical protein